MESPKASSLKLAKTQTNGTLVLLSSELATSLNLSSGSPLCQPPLCTFLSYPSIVWLVYIYKLAMIFFLLSLNILYLLSVGNFNALEYSLMKCYSNIMYIVKSLTFLLWCKKCQTEHRGAQAWRWLGLRVLGMIL